MSQNSPQLIIAGNSRQAHHLAKFCMGLKPVDWCHINDGTREWISRYPSSIWLYGTYYERRDWCEIQEKCKLRGITLLQIQEVRL